MKITKGKVKGIVKIEPIETNKKGILKWFGNLFSDNNSTSSRRFIAIQAFYFISYLILVATLKTNLPEQNIKLLLQIEEHLYYIVILGLGLTTTTGIVKMITARYPAPPPQNPYFFQPPIEPTVTSEQTTQ